MAMMLAAACSPCWMATGASIGSASPPSLELGKVTDHLHLVVAGELERRAHRHPPRPRGRAVSCSPSGEARTPAVQITVAASMRVPSSSVIAARVSLDDGASEHELDAALAEHAGGHGAEPRMERVEHALATLDQHHPHRREVESREVLGQEVREQLAERARVLDAGGAAAQR